MADIRIKELTELTELTDNDYFVVDNSASGGETKKYRATRVTEMIGAVAEEIEEKITPSIDTALAVGSASGDIASFSDGSNLPMPKLQVGIEPVQDLHGYDHPWVGGAGKNKCNPNINEWNNLTYKYIKLPNFNDDNYIMSFVDKDTSVDLAGINFGFMHNYPDESTQFRWVIINGEIQSDKTNISQVDRTTKCDTLIIYPNTQSAFERIFARYNVQVEKGTTATSFEPYSNICPISGWDECNVSVCGTNVWDEEWESGLYSVSTGKKVNNANYIRSKNLIPILPNKEYYLKTTANKNYIVCFDQNGQFISTITRATSGKITTPANAYFIGLDILGTTYNNDISINYPSTDTSYHAYNGHTYTIDLDGTRYGGTLDVVSGVLTVDRAYVDMGSLTWAYQSTPKVFNTNISGLKRGILVCSNYKYTDVNYVDQIKDGEIWDKNNAFGLTNVVVKDLRYTSASDFKTAMNGVQLVYELATPQNIQLTPTQVKSLLGINNIWADTGDILDATYVRNANITINDLIRRIEALEG